MIIDVLTVGNALIDAYLTLQDSNTAVRLNKAERELCVAYGEKIALQSCTFLLGGNAANVAVGLTRLGLKTAIMAEIAQDEFSEKIVNGLTHEGVSKEYLIRHPGESSFSISLNFKDERTLFVEHREREHNFHFDSVKTKAVYLTSLGHTWKHVYERVAKYVQKEHVEVLAFNPGSVQFQDGIQTFSFILPLTTILFINKEEGEKIAGKHESIEALLRALKAKGPKLVSLTNGEQGAYLIDEHDTIYHQKKIECPVVERTGAGDAYATGFLAGYLAALPLTTCMLWGAHNAASVIGQTGSQPGLLREEEVRTIQ